MRPADQHNQGSLFECDECGHRATDPTSRVCPECTGRLVNIGTSRDL